MSTADERADQRRAWRQALAAAAAVKRNQRYRPAEPAIRAGMIRKDGQRPPASERPATKDGPPHLTKEYPMPDDKGRHERIAPVVIGILIAIHDGNYENAETLIRGLYVGELVGAVRQFADLVIRILQSAGLSDEDIRAELAKAALERALDDDD